MYSIVLNQPQCILFNVTNESQTDAHQLQIAISAVEHFESLDADSSVLDLMEAQLECAKAIMNTDCPNQGEAAELALRVQDHAIVVNTRVFLATMFFEALKEKRSPGKAILAA